MIRVIAADACGLNIRLAGMLGVKWSIRCGHCNHTFRARLPVICPACRAVNVLPLVRA